MNKIIILGNVIYVSEIHFDYADKLKAHFIVCIDDFDGNIFEVMFLEKELGITKLDCLYKLVNKTIYSGKSCDSNHFICIEGSIIKYKCETLILGTNLYI